MLVGLFGSAMFSDLQDPERGTVICMFVFL